MKRVLMLLVFLSGFVFAQDVIYKSDGTEIKAKVLEILPDMIKYKKFENLDGPTYNIGRDEVFMIAYQNGQREVFKKKEELPKPAPVQKEEPKVIPPPIQQPEQPAVQPPESGDTPVSKVVGLYVNVLLGFNSMKEMSTSMEIDGKSSNVDIDAASETGFLFSMNVILQTSPNFALVMGGSVDNYKAGYMAPYYMGVNFYFSENVFAPYMFARAGYATGKLDNPAKLNEKISSNGFYLGGGLGFKFFVGATWGFNGDLGYKYQQSVVEYDARIASVIRKIKSTQYLGGVSLGLGVFLKLN